MNPADTTLGPDAPASQRRVHVHTLGCQMNENDSEVMLGALSQQGYRAAPEQDADVLLINTCAVREFSEHKAFSKVGEWGKRKRENPDLLIGIVGCMAQNRHAELKRRLPFVDIICGPQHVARMPGFIDRARARRKALVEIAQDGEFSLKALPILRSDPLKAYVTIMRGCDKTCTYCIVPKTRGKEISRDPQEILEEIEGLASQGYKEVTLLGQNVNSYGKAPSSFKPASLDGGATEGGFSDFSELLRRVHGVEGIERIRFLTSHPMDISEGMIEAMGDLPKVCEYLHFPLQSGSDRVLKRMKRYYTMEGYMELVAAIRKKKPGIALSTDIIVGFPGERREDFQKTVEALRAIRFDMAYVFKYSLRPGTPAEKLGDDVSREEKERRHAELLDLQGDITLQYNQEWVGKDVEVLVEGPSPKNPDRWTGRTRENKVALFPAGMGAQGDLVRMRVGEFTQSTLRCQGP